MHVRDEVTLSIKKNDLAQFLFSFDTKTMRLHFFLNDNFQIHSTGLLFTEPSEIDRGISELTTIVDQLKATRTSEKQLSQDEAAYMGVVKTRRLEGLKIIVSEHNTRDSSGRD